MKYAESQSTLKRLNLVAIIQAGVWTLLVLLSLIWNLTHHWHQLTQLALGEGRIAIEKDVIYRRWNASVSPVYVRSSERTPPNPYLADFPERDIETPSGIHLTLMNPAYMTRLVHEMGELASGVRSHITSLNPLRKRNRPDPWERQALERFEAGEREVSEIRRLENSQRYMRVIRPLITEKVCLKCHADQGYHEGDIRGGLSVSVPLKPLEEAFMQHLWVIGGGHTVLWLVVLGLILWTSRRISGEMRNRFQVEGQLEGEKEAQQRLIEQLKATQGQLLQSDKLASLGQLAAGVAHEINNPVGYIHSNLNTLKGYLLDMEKLAEAGARLEAECPGDSETLVRLRALRQELDEAFLREDAAALVNESLEGAEQVKKIVLDLKTFARPDQEQWGEVDLNENLASTLNILRSELGQKAEIIVDFENLPPVRGVPGRLNQVFVNLLLNASQAIQQQQGTIRVRSLSRDAEAVVEITDTGSGIQQEHLDHLFEPFFTTKPVGQGTGLGLSIAYGIVKEHGGEIQVESTPGRGSLFRVILPLTREG